MRLLVLGFLVGLVFSGFFAVFFLRAESAVPQNLGNIPMSIFLAILSTASLGFILWSIYLFAGWSAGVQ